MKNLTPMILLICVIAGTGVLIRTGAAEAASIFSSPLPGAEGGIALSRWSGGPASEFNAAAADQGCALASAWITKPDGKLLGLLNGAPGFVNQAFFENFSSGSVPADTLLLVVCHRTASTESPGAVATLNAVRGLDVSRRARVPLAASAVVASSSNSSTETPASLVRPAVDGYWHVLASDQVKGVGWVQLELSAATNVTELRVRPRADLPAQMWDGDRAKWQGSADGTSWTTIASLGLDRASLVTDWYGYRIPSASSYRYYRLLIEDPTFRSLAGLELYAGPALVSNDAAPAVAAVRSPSLVGRQQISLTTSQVSVSSQNSAGEGAANLVASGTQGYWHVLPSEQIKGTGGWAKIDLGTVGGVGLLVIRPREGLPNQLWDGSQAVLQGSADGENWSTIARLIMNRSTAEDGAYGFTAPAGGEAYRYYRLFVLDPTFRSLGRIELYR